jgi:predicted nucleotidyltransferase
MALARLIRELRSHYGPRLRKVILYGSRARGDFTEHSDLDVLVVLKNMGLRYEEIKKINEIASPLSLACNLVISVFPVSEQYFEKYQDTNFLHQVLKDGVILCA